MSKMQPTREKLSQYLYLHNYNSNRESSWLPLILDGSVSRNVKTVLVDKAGVETIGCRVHVLRLSKLLELSDPYWTIDVKSWQRLMKEENPILKLNKKSALKSAWSNRGVPYEWETSNQFESSMMLKVPKYLEYCATGTDPLIYKVKRTLKIQPGEDKRQKIIAVRGGYIEKASECKRPQTLDKCHGNMRECPEMRELMKIGTSAINSSLDEEFDEDDEPEPMKRVIVSNVAKVAKVANVAKKPAQTTAIAYNDETARAVVKHGVISVANDRLPTKPTQRGDESITRRLPPSAPVQLLRTAALCTPLISYLKERKLFSRIGKSHWRAISAWTKTEEGVQYLRAADLDPLGVQLDHIVPRNGTAKGMDSIYNCAFLPPAANGWFGDTDTREKRAYLGHFAVEIAGRFSGWARAKLMDMHLDQSKFDPHVT